MKINKKEDIKLFRLNKADWNNKSEKLVIHHTAARKSKIPKQFLRINEWHKNRKPPFSKKSLGYHVGYTFVIEGNGDIMQGRALGEETAAQRGFNFKYTAVCFAGDFRFEELSKEQFESYKKLKKWLDEIMGYKLEALPHSDLAQTSCPAFKVNTLEEYIRENDNSEMVLPKSLLFIQIKNIFAALIEMLKILGPNSKK